jgi:uncharacterized Fe-S cluster protein YjdI
MANNITKKYSNGEISVVWKPNLCIHSEICVKTLPEVYKPKEKPWINPENASTAALKKQIAKCPSGALSYVVNGQEENESTSTSTRADVLEDGPLLIHGNLTVKGIDGEEVEKSSTTAFCRCGMSNNKPYCDGTHAKEGFKG